MAGQTRQIIHVDMDAFYASVEIHDNPDLAGKCVIVGGSPESRGVVSAASYEARKFGVHSAMPTAQAKRLCPQAVFLPVRMNRYNAVSRKIRRIFERFSPIVEPISLDEAFLDATGSMRIYGDAQRIGHLIKDSIKEETGLIASVGIAPNKFLAKLASDLEKPNGFTVITEENKIEKLRPLEIRRLWGVGKVTASVLKSHGITKIGDLQDMDLATLRHLIGNAAYDLKRLAIGEDDRPVELPRKAKSISQEHTFERDIGDKNILLDVLVQQVETVAMRLRNTHLRAGGVTLKFRYGDFTTLTRSHKLSRPTNSTAALLKVATDVLDEWWDKKGAPLRLLGFGADRLSAEQGGQMDLFPDLEEEKHSKIDKTVDEIKKKFGPDIIGRGGA